MLAEPTANDLVGDDADAIIDRSMLVLQYLLAGIALIAALLLTAVH